MIVGPIVILLALIGGIAIIAWTVQWLSLERGGSTAREILDARFAKGEIDKTEYEEKRRLISQKP
jgi:putative membrane protein